MTELLSRVKVTNFFLIYHFCIDNVCVQLAKNQVLQQSVHDAITLNIQCKFSNYVNPIL